MIDDCGSLRKKCALQKWAVLGGCFGQLATRYWVSAGYVPRFTPPEGSFVNLLAQMTNTVLRSARAEKKAVPPRNPPYRSADCPWPMRLAPQFSASKGASSFFSGRPRPEFFSPTERASPRVFFFLAAKPATTAEYSGTGPRRCRLRENRRKGPLRG